SNSGVAVAGRLSGVDGSRVRFDDDLPVATGAADRRLRRTLARIDAYVEASGLAGEVLPPEEIEPVMLPSGPATLDLRAAGISTVVWATGFEFRYPWLHVPVLNGAGQIDQYRGVTSASGLYVIGLRFM